MGKPSDQDLYEIILKRLPKSVMEAYSTASREAKEGLFFVLDLIVWTARQETDKRSRAEWIDDQKRIRKAAVALQSLPVPYLEFYGGIATHLLTEAEGIDEKIRGLPRGAGRPSEKGKFWLVDQVSRMLAHLDVGKGSPYPPLLLHIEIAKSLWEALTNEHTSLKSWQVLVKKYHAQSKKMYKPEVQAKWKEMLESEEIE